MKPKRLVVVSNRLPVVLQETGQGRWTVQPGTGGLITALNPVLRDRGGLWIGWLGFAAEEGTTRPAWKKLLAEGASQIGHALIPVQLTKDEVQNYYYGFSNEVLWPLFHDFSARCRFSPPYWEAYERVNHKFAETVAESTQQGDHIWVQDYHLLLVARELKRLGVKRHAGFFLHIPFPPLDLFLKMPWRFQVLEGLLEYDLVGFQTVRDLRNFTHCVRTLIEGTHTSGRGQVLTVTTPQRKVRVGAFPISIDFRDFADFAASKPVADEAWIIHANHPNRKIILGVDRLDYTKGIPDRLLAFAHTLRRYPDLRGKVTFIQIVVPSRREVEEYEALKSEIERLVGEINGEFTQVGWTPIQYIFRTLNRKELIAYYRTCEIALLTPLKDGMNLVAKEYCAGSIEEDGVLILSEFAGAAAQLAHSALLVNPYDIDGVADAIYRAFRMDFDERQKRMKRLRRSIRRHDIFRWVNAYLAAGVSKDLKDLPLAQLFVPRSNT